MTRNPGDSPTLPEPSRRGNRPRKPLFPNPFYVLLLLSSTAFVLTALLFSISPFVVERGIRNPGAAPGRGSAALVNWLDVHGPSALAIAFVVMLVSGFLAMATDQWFSPKPPGPPSK